LLDTNDLSEHFNSDELDALGRIQVGYGIRPPDGIGEILHQAPLISRDAGLKVFYVPWQIRTPPDDLGRALIARSSRYVRLKAGRDLLSIRLERRQSLFIDNRRLLHGRGALPEDSRRHLVRLYIRSD